MKQADQTKPPTSTPNPKPYNKTARNILYNNFPKRPSQSINPKFNPTQFRIQHKG